MRNLQNPSCGGAVPRCADAFFLLERFSRRPRDILRQWLLHEVHPEDLKSYSRRLTIANPSGKHVPPVELDGLAWRPRLEMPGRIDPGPQGGSGRAWSAPRVPPGGSRRL